MTGKGTVRTEQDPEAETGLQCWAFIFLQQLRSPTGETCIESNWLSSSPDGRQAQETLFLTEVLLAMVGCWGLGPPVACLHSCGDTHTHLHTAPTGLSGLLLIIIQVNMKVGGENVEVKEEGG